MLLTCWSVKGGAGTTVVAAALASSLARHHAASGGALVVDLAGDMPVILGFPDPRDPGLTGWTRASGEVAGDALARLELSVGTHLSLLPRGTGAAGPASRHAVLAGLLAADPRPVVVDAGVVDDLSPALPLVAGATRSLLVTRPCSLSLHRAVDAPIRPSGVILLTEPGHPYGADEVEHMVGAPVVAQVPVDPAVARAVDGGTFSAHLPRSLQRSLRRAA